jgi:thiamine kinase-like enzyme
VLGPRIVQNRVLRSARGQVVELIDGDGDRWFAKRMNLPRQWTQEMRAYREWVPSLGESAPRVHAADERLQTIVLTALPGQRVTIRDWDVYRQAGSLLRRFHDSRSSKPASRHVGEKAARRLERQLSRGEGLFSAAEVDFARSRVRRLADLTLDSWVPCHGDFGPHNWLRDDVGVVRVIDFADSRWHVPAYDLGRLYYGSWWRRPGLAEPFFDGYGRWPTESELEFVSLHIVINAATSVVWGRENGQARVEAVGHHRLGLLKSGDWTPGGGLRTVPR